MGVTPTNTTERSRRRVRAEHLRLDNDVEVHSHDVVELALVRDGRAVQRSADDVTDIRSGHVLILTPGTRHSLESNCLLTTNVFLDPTLFVDELSWITKDPGWGAAFSPQSRAPRPVLILDADGRTAQLAELFDELAAGTGRSRDLGIGIFEQYALLFAAFSVLEPLVSDTVDSREERGYRATVELAVEVMSNNLDHPWTLGSLATEVALSPSQLSRVFVADTGSSPMSYLQTLRVERLASLLRTTELSISGAARAVGWHDPGHAARRFRSRWQCSPNQYRERFR